MIHHRALAAFIVASMASCVPSPSSEANAGHVPASQNHGEAGIAMEKSLAGRWHCNTDGATKQFDPGANPKQGRAYGFWPTGGIYRVVESDPASRVLKLHLSIEENEDHDAQELEATVMFHDDGKHMTFTRKGKGSFVYYRTR